MDDAEYQKEYDKAMKALDGEAAGEPTTAKTEEVEAKAPPETPAKVEPDAKHDATDKPKDDEKPKEPDPLEEIRAKLAKTEKALKDTQKWGTQNAQELAQLKRESDERKRQAERPAILDANPGLEEAIKHVVPTPEPQGPDQWAIRNQIINEAHPGIFNKDVPDELVKGILARFDALGDDINDPLICIREITAEKLAHTEREIGKRFAAESAKAAQKTAMSVPGAGGAGARVPVDADLAAKDRILNMTSAEFEKERRRVLGY